MRGAEQDTSRDEADYSTLERVKDTLVKRRDYYKTIDSIDASGKSSLTVEQQIHLAKTMQSELELIIALVDTAISNIDEKYNQIDEEDD